MFAELCKWGKEKSKLPAFLVGVQMSMFQNDFPLFFTFELAIGQDECSAQLQYLFVALSALELHCGRWSFTIHSLNMSSL
eukprot:1216453-Amphidinium_carterae.1